MSADAFKTPPKPKQHQRSRLLPDQEQQGLLATPTPPIRSTRREGRTISSRLMRHNNIDDSSNISMCVELPPPKVVYLIRHGESLGQVAGRASRETDATLTDCGLTERGQRQAANIRRHLIGAASADEQQIQLVVSSPLTRALQTACLAFGAPEDTVPILCHYHLREMGSMIPENRPRPVEHVLRDLQGQWGVPETVLQRLDTASLQPAFWPRHHDTPPNVVRRDRIRQVFQWLAVSRDETCIAIICHYHVIRAALQDPYHHASAFAHSAAAAAEIWPRNGCPIKCHLCPATGRLTLASVNEC